MHWGLNWGRGVIFDKSKRKSLRHRSPQSASQLSSRLLPALLLGEYPFECHIEAIQITDPRQQQRQHKITLGLV